MKEYLKNKFIQNKGKKIIRRTNNELTTNLNTSFFPNEIDVPLIRLGGNSGGGYIIPDDLENISACFSPGVSDIS